MATSRKPPVNRMCFQCGGTYPVSARATNSRYCNRDCKLAYYRAKKPLGPKRRLWTDEDVAFLKDNYRSMGPRAVAKHLGRAIACVRSKAYLVDAPLTLWDEREIEYLKRHLKTDGIDAVSTHLHRPRDGVRAKASQLGLLSVIRKNHAIPTIKTRVVAEQIAAENGITLSDILGFSRKRRICHARWRLMRVLSDMGYSLRRIGISLGMDHTTISYGLDRHAEMTAMRDVAE